MKPLRSLGRHLGCPPQIPRSRRAKTSGTLLGNNYAHLSTAREWVKGEEAGEGRLGNPQGVTPIGSSGNRLMNPPPRGLKPRKVSPPASHSQHGSSSETDAVKRKVEHLMRRNSRGTLNGAVFEILSLINQHKKNKDVYIDRRILIAFHKLLIKKKYHLNVSKGSICNDLHPTIFDYIHHNVNLHLKHYHLSNVSELLPGVAKYLHRVNPSESTKQLIKNIFFFHFFSHFNNFYYSRGRGSLDSFSDGGAFLKKSGHICERGELLGKPPNGGDLPERLPIGGNLPKEGTPTEDCPPHGERNPSGRAAHQLGTPPNGRLTERPPKQSNHCDHPNQRDQDTFRHLNSYVLFLSNHPRYASEKVLHTISLLANKVTQVNVSPQLALSFLSSSVSLFDKQKGDRRRFLLHRGVNYHVLHAVIKGWNEQLWGTVEGVAQGGDLLSGEDQHRGDQPRSVLLNEAKNAPPPAVPNLWAYSHIINALKILKVRHFLSPKFSFSGEAEGCLVKLFSGAMGLLGGFTGHVRASLTMGEECATAGRLEECTPLDRLKECTPLDRLKECPPHWSAAPTQNELNSIATIYVNMAILLQEVKNRGTLRSSLTQTMNSCYSIVSVYHPMLHENMSINLVRGIYHQMAAYTDVSSFSGCFYQMEEAEGGRDSPTCGDFQSRKGETVMVPTPLLHLLKEVTNCLLFPSREERKLPTNKLITVLQYLHKANTICLPFTHSETLKGCISSLLREIGKHIESEEAVVSKHHLLMFINVDLSHRGGQLNVPLLHACVSRLEEGASNLFENEAEIILFLSFLKRFREATKVYRSFTRSEDPSQHEETFLFSGEAPTNRSLEELNRMVTRLADKVTRVVFFPRDGTTASPPGVAVTSLNSATSPKSATSPNWFNQTPPTKGVPRVHPLREYPLKVYFLAYEHIFPNEPNEEPVKEALLNQLTHLMQLQKGQLNEEDFFSILSALLKHKIVEHDAYQLYASFLQSRGGSIQVKFVSLVLKRILEEISLGDPLRMCPHGTPPQVSVTPPLMSIITTSSDLILQDKKYRENFPLFKEILHVYLERYPCFGEIAPQFNLFLLDHFHNFVGTLEHLNGHEIATLAYHVASFYYTVGKFSIERFGACGIKMDSSCERVASEWGEKKEQAGGGGDSIGSSIRLLRMPPQNGAKMDGASHVNSQRENTTTPSGKNKVKVTTYSEQDMGRKLLQQLHSLFDALYKEELKRGAHNDQMNLPLSTTVRVFLSLKNAKVRHSDLMRVLSERCISAMFFQRGVMNLELQIRFLNSVVFLDYLNAVDEAFLRLARRLSPAAHTASTQGQHILYAHFQQLPRRAIHTPNISTYLLNFVSILEYLPLEHQREGSRRAALWLCELLRVFFREEVGPSAEGSRGSGKESGELSGELSGKRSGKLRCCYSPPPTNLDKRNAVLLLALLHLGSHSPLNISALPLKFLQQFYSHFILSEFAHLGGGSNVRSSSTHRSIYNFVEAYLRREFPHCHIYNEEEVLLFRVDLVILERRHSGVSTCVC